MGKAVTAKKASMANKTYTVSGDTLEEIQDDLFAKQIGGTDAVGDCSTTVTAPSISRFDEKENPKPKKKGTVEYTVTAKPGPKVEMTGTITLPVLKSDKKLSAKAKKEWQRFIGKLTAHENEHVKVAQAVADAIADELSGMEGRGAGKDKKTAVKAAVADYVKQYKAAYGGSKVAERVAKAHAALDKKGNTFTLDVNID